MNESDLRMLPVRLVSASLPALTTIQTLRTIDYYLIPQVLILRNTGESFLSCFCFFVNHALNKILSGLNFGALPYPCQRYGWPAIALFQAPWQSSGCRWDLASPNGPFGLKVCLLR